MIQIYSIFIFCISLVISIPSITSAQSVTNPTEPTLVSVFTRDECSHCRDEKDFLENLSKDGKSIKIEYYNLSEPQNELLFDQITTKYTLVKATPITLINGQLLQGFDSARTTGKSITAMLAENQTNLGFADILVTEARLLTVNTTDVVCNEYEPCIANNQLLITIPLINITVDIGNYPIPALSMILGFIDGFNPCAMWVLIMFLVILSQLGSKRKMWIYTSIFILAEAIMYWFILNVWLTTWNFIKLDQIVTPLVGVLSLGSGLYFVYKFKTYQPVCTVTNAEQRKTITERAKYLASKPMTLGVFLGILGLAFSVNIFEFACSIGIPQTFTKVIEMNSIHWFDSQFYMALYILMYMVDDAIVFGLALYSFEKIGVTHKYSKWSSLVGGLLMLILGILLLFKPEWLVF